jgi:ABC-2 type transport system permease protein
MKGPAIELFVGPFRLLRRSLVGWAIGLGSLVVVTVAFWPAFRGSSGISEAIDQLPSGVIEAFGLAGFGTPGGFLRGNLYELIIPLLLTIGTVATANGLTASDEEAGRMEIQLSQPVTRRSVFLGRATAMIAWLTVMTAIVLVVQLASDALVGLDIDAARVVSTVLLCGSIALLFGSLALAVAGWLARPSLVLAVGIAAAFAAYLTAALPPLDDRLEPLSRLSPWDWAMGADPLLHATEPWRYLVLVGPAVLLIVIAVIGFGRRDVRAA